MNGMRTGMLVAAACAALAAPAAENGDARRILVLADEPRMKLHYWDSANAGAGRAVTVEKPVWDLKRVGKTTFRTVCGGGFQVTDLAEGKVVETFRHPSLSAPDFVVTAVCDLPDGGFVASVNPQKKPDFGRVTLLRRFDAARKLTATYRLEGFFYARTLRRDREEGVYLLAWEKGFARVRVPAEPDGKAEVLADFRQPKGRNLFDVVPALNGTGYVAGCGYGGGLVTFDASGKPERTWFVPTGNGKASLFYAQVQERPDGHVYLAHWTGHGEMDSRKGWQVVEFDASGRVAWHLDDPERFGSISGVVVLDEAL